jgi:hypothetical protein
LHTGVQNALAKVREYISRSGQPVPALVIEELNTLLQFAKSYQQPDVLPEV